MLKELIGDMSSMIRDIDGKVDDIREQTTLASASVKRNIADIRCLTETQSRTNSEIATLAATQNNCQARKAHESGTSTDRSANLIGFASCMVAVIAAIVAVVALFTT